MSVVCNVCGSANRPKAKYCVGCAHPLPGFTPSGPAAFDAVMAIRPAPDATPRGAVGARAGAAVPVLPAETAAFWLKAGCVGLAMILGFAAWCFHVTHKPGAPPLKEQILALVMPESLKPRALPAATVPSTAGVSADEAQEARPAALRITPTVQSAAMSAEPQVARPIPPLAAEPRPIARARKALASSRRNLRDALPPAAAESPIARATPDPGPPIAPGPGPLYDRGQASSLRRFADSGPPVVPGPGPLYKFSRAPVRAPFGPSGPSGNDPGPPLAAGPGPQFDYSARAAATR